MDRNQNEFNKRYHCHLYILFSTVISTTFSVSVQNDSTWKRFENHHRTLSLNLFTKQQWFSQNKSGFLFIIAKSVFGSNIPLILFKTTI